MGGTAIASAVTAGVRSGMTDLVTRLRVRVADQGKAYWTDAQLQDYLDENKFRVAREPLDVERTLTSGTSYEYKIYRSRYGNWESGGTVYFKVEDSAGSARGTGDYSVDYLAGVVTMSADQVGTQLYLTGCHYDLDGAASRVWTAMAGSVSDQYSVSADGHTMNRAEWFEHCVNMAELYAKRGVAQTANLFTFEG